MSEAQIRQALDGWFYTLDHEKGRTIGIEVPADYIPSHKPKYDASGDVEVHYGHQWTAVEDATILAMREAGNSFRAISAAIGMSVTAVTRRHSALVPGHRPRVARRRWHSDEIVQRVLALREINLPFPEIGREVGVTKQQARDIYRHHQLRKAREEWAA